LKNLKIVKKNIKNLTIKITFDCEVLVSIPKYYPKFLIDNFINSKQEWIKNRIYKCKNYYLGKKYNIDFSNEFYYSEAKILFNKLIKKYHPYINKPINKIRIKKMTTRWGSCNYKKGYINLNLYLIKKDIKFIEYVILHELTHLIYPNHSKDFYNFIRNIMPDYKDRIKNV
jgi:predicted metal-dependent hydrolase